MKMNLQRRWILLAVLAFICAGCGDTPQSVFRQALTVQDELADAMIQVKDEQSADAIYKNKVEMLKKRWDGIQQLAEKMFAKDAKAEKKRTFYTGYIAIVDEAVEVDKLIKAQVSRLNNLRKQSYIQDFGSVEGVSDATLDGQYPKITQMMRAPDSFKMDRIWSDNPMVKKTTGGGFGFPGGFPGGGG